jgi:glutamate racemase
VVEDIAPVTTRGTGTVVGLVTETPDYPAHQFNAMLGRLNIDIPLSVVAVP